MLMTKPALERRDFKSMRKTAFIAKHVISKIHLKTLIGQSLKEVAAQFMSTLKKVKIIK